MCHGDGDGQSSVKNELSMDDLSSSFSTNDLSNSFLVVSFSMNNRVKREITEKERV